MQLDRQQQVALEVHAALEERFGTGELAAVQRAPALHVEADEEIGRLEPAVVPGDDGVFDVDGEE